MMSAAPQDHVHESCRSKDLFGFNPTGLWVESPSYAPIKGKLVADGTPNGFQQLPRVRGGGKKENTRTLPHQP